MRIDVEFNAAESHSYRAARVRSLFNVDSADVRISADLPIEGMDWSLGLIVGPSGSGKTTIGARIFGPEALYRPHGWPDDMPIIDAIAPSADVDEVTGALASVGLGTVPAWLRPYRLLSNGERFRADLARTICDRPARIVIDEFTSVVDRQIARIGALAFGKAWRRTGGQAVLLSCHYDIIDWLQPDWIYDTATGRFSGRGLQRRPDIHIDIIETNWGWWPLFEPHHYLALPRMIAATCYVGLVGGAPVAHVAFAPRPGLIEARASRLVIMPEWQGAGIGMRFLNAICARWRRGLNRYGRPMRTLFHTTHPGLVAALRRDPMWAQVSSAFWGGDKRRSSASMRRSGVKSSHGYGGHWRAVRGFRYVE